MDARKSYTKYLNEKSRIAFNHNGYALEKILAMDLISEVYLNPTLKIKTLRYFLLAFSFETLQDKDSSKTLFSIGPYPRKDYYEILEYARSKTSVSELLDFNLIKPKYRVNLSTIIFSCKHIFKHTNLSFKSKLFLSSQLTFYLNTIKELEKSKPDFKKYCAFSSVHQLEAILTLYFQKIKRTTYSLQHGVYYVFDKLVPLDAIVFENFISDKHLCWGKFTADEFTRYGIPATSLVVAGYPRKVERNKPPLTLNQNKCVVLLARRTFDNSNTNLITLLKQYSAKHKVNITIKLHPSLSRTSYEKLCSSLGWELIDNQSTLSDIFRNKNYGWAIAVNTAAYYEAYLNYLPCLRYNDGAFEDSEQVFSDNFKNLQQLEICIKTIPFKNRAKINEYFSLVDDRLKYILGFGLENYSILDH